MSLNDLGGDAQLAIFKFTCFRNGLDFINAELVLLDPSSPWQTDAV